MDIYVKPTKKALIKGKNTVKIKDIAEIIASESVKARIEELTILIKTESKPNYLLSIADIIRVILKEYPDSTIVNIGSKDILVEFETEKSENKIIKYLKIVFISTILFTGAATAIMSFHSDAQIPKVFQNYYEIFFGEYKEDPLIIEIPYSIGLALGIIVFFNHFGG
ncbi:MAG: hypothetical protein E7234_00810, partial [Lachnospiraceae bacterium]|nr:hypothetical protein [Lachnospiraceae bacterium]